MCRFAANEMGDPFQPFIYGQTYVPLRVAAAHNISLIMDGENGEAEYGGDIASASLRGFSADDVERYWLSGFPLEFWENHEFSVGDLEVYRPPAHMKWVTDCSSHISSHTTKIGDPKSTITTVLAIQGFSPIPKVGVREPFQSMRLSTMR